MATLTFAMALLLAVGTTARAQTATRAEFDVVSVKPGRDAERSLLLATPGRFSATGIALNRLLMVAYDLQDFQVVDAPSWAVTQKYDITARADDDATTEQMEGPMLQKLLQERFALRSHRETRLLPVFELTVADRGPRFVPSKKNNCRTYVKTAQPAVTVDAGGQQLPFCGFRRNAENANRMLDGTGVSLADLAANLSRSYNTALGRTVVDKTGIAGTFDLKLQWTNDPDAPSLQGTTTNANTSDSSIFTALQDQLGLKLRQARGPVEVLVVDHIEQPSPN